MVPLCAASVEDLGLGDFVQIDCAPRCRMLLRQNFVAHTGVAETGIHETTRVLDPRLKVLNLAMRGRCGPGDRAIIGIRWTETADQGV
jgi:hypothetical protein